MSAQLLTQVPKLSNWSAHFAPTWLLLSLEGVSGLDVARQLRKVGVIPIALTGFADEAHRQLAAEAGFMAYLVKPVALTRLQATLNRFTRRHPMS
jgi:DNA-binding response OmpR family regulator